MQGIYNYMPETNHTSRVYNFVAILYLQFMVHVMLCGQFQNQPLISWLKKYKI